MPALNGCICGTLREDLLKEVKKLARQKKFDYLLIESTGIYEPLPVAETFTFMDEAGNSLSDFAKLDTMVTVVDAANFLVEFQKADTLKERRAALGDDDERTISDLLVDQVEFCDVLVINKTDLVKPADLAKLKGILHGLNPRAKIVEAAHGKVPLKKVINTGSFDFAKAQEAPGWLKTLRGEEISETEEYGISSFVYRSRKPFHPQRFNQLLTGGLPGFWKGVVRSKGHFWIASRTAQAGLWQQAGGAGTHSCAGYWWAAVVRSQWPKDKAGRGQIDALWQEPFGDRRQELVFIGKGMNESLIRESLNDALLSGREMLLGSDKWEGLPDPFPKWDQREIGDGKEAGSVR